MKVLVSILTLFFMSQQVAAEDYITVDEHFNEFSEKEEASIWAIEYSIKDLLKTSPRHKLNRNLGARRNFAESVMLASSLYSNVPWEVILGIAYSESTFRSKVRGSIGERGVMQVHGVAWKECRETIPYLDKDNVEHQLICGSLWFEHSIQQCDGSVYQGMARYMTGSVCQPKKGGELDRQVKRRLRIIQKIRRPWLDTYILSESVY